MERETKADDHFLLRPFVVRNEWTPPPFRKNEKKNVPFQLGVFFFGAVLGVSLLSHLHLSGWLATDLGAAVVMGGSALLSARRLRRLNRDALEQLAQKAEHLPELQGLPDGELVRVRGTVVERQGALSQGGVVYERSRRGKTLEERASDFSIIDEKLGEIWIDVADARLVHPSGDQGSLRDHRVRVGDLVEVIGWKARTMDQSVSERLDRQEPTRIVLRSGKSLPLLIIPFGATALAPVLEQRRLTSS